jgi:hypothetical protein
MERGIVCPGKKLLFESLGHWGCGTTLGEGEKHWKEGKDENEREVPQIYSRHFSTPHSAHFEPVPAIIY